MITAIKVAVAFQTICHTTGISATCTPPVASASAAPNAALQPILTPRLPDHQHRGQDKNRTCQQHRSSANHIRKIIYVKINFYRQPGPPASLLIISRTSSC